MRKLLTSLALAVAALSATAAEAPLWLRHNAISPDGTRIAFTYRGDIYIVPVGGGRAEQLTSHAGHDTDPVWSPDSRSIAFASDRLGGMDVFIVDAGGGEPRRLTTHSTAERPVAFLSDSVVLFSANIMPSAEDAQFPSGQFPQVYSVPTRGGRPHLFSSLPMEHIWVNGDGTKLLYQDRKGYEDPWRKHEMASITRDIWLCTLGDERAYAKQTDFEGEDREPVWAPDGESFYYLSEQDGTSNVWRRRVGAKDAEQVTRFEKNPVRFLTIAGDGTLCFSQDGELYTLREGGQPQKVEIEIVADKLDRDVVRRLRTSGATEISPSPTGKEVAFVMGGDVYVTSVDYRTTRQITSTQDQERGVQFSPDGRSLVYASERDGLWQIYEATIADKEEKQFTYATDIRERNLTNSKVASFQPAYSPDGKEVAFLEDRTAIRVVNLKSGKVRTAMEGKWQYSYADGDQHFEWSPDSRWILSDYIGHGGWNNKDVVLVKADGSGEMHNLTQSGYTDQNASWALDGKAMIWYSDRAGYRSHGSWGAEFDVYIMFFDVEAYEQFRMNREDLALMEENKSQKEKKEDEKKAEAEKKADEKADKKGEAAVAEVEPLEFDLENCRDRVVRLTSHSARGVGALLSKKGDKLYYIASSEESAADLWVRDLKDYSLRMLVKGIGGGQMVADRNVENIYMCSGGLKRVSLASGETKWIEFEAFQDYRPYEERDYIFNHVWSQVKDKFYDVDLHGVDWEYYRGVYERFLPHINNNYDFTEMLSEMLGELNASHTGARYYGPGASLATASLGVFYDEEYEGDGLKIKEVIAKSPFAVMKTDVEAGCIIESVDGEKILAGEDYYPLFEGKVGRKIRLGIRKGGKTFEVSVRGIGAGEVNELLYNRWRERCRKEVERLSDGRVGYVHIRAMDSESFRHLYSELLGRFRNCEAVVIDTRHNGGGWLHDDVVTLLGGKEYQQFVPRGQYIGSDPFNKWLRPSCMLICEDNYSNACGTPWVYKELGLGKLVGTPVPGTMTAVWWETQIDPSIVFGIPQVGCRDMRGVFSENTQVEPDIYVVTPPEAQLRGEDLQLRRAVELMLETVGDKPAADTTDEAARQEKERTSKKK